MDWKENMSKEEFEKAIQSTSDKVRTEYSQKIKELEGKLPPVKTEQELALEKREQELLKKENFIKVQETLTTNNLPPSLARYLNAGDDIETFGKEISEILNNHLLNTSHQPSKHNNKGDAVTKEEFAKMNYMQRSQLEESNPELYKKLSQ